MEDDPTIHCDPTVLDQKPISQKIVGREEKRRLETELKKSKMGYKSGESLDKSNSGRDDEPLEVYYLGENQIFKF